MFDTINFYGSKLYVTRDSNGVGWVAIKPICEAIGISFGSQRAKLVSDPELNCVDIDTVAEDGKRRSMVCLPISQLNGWLYTINPNKVRSNIKVKLVRYQQECRDVLFQHFMPNGGTNEEIMGALDRLESRMETRLDNALTKLKHDMEESFRAVRYELEELRALVHVAMSDTDELEIRDLLAKVKEETGMDGRAIVGHVRGTLGTSSIYHTPDLEVVKRVLQNMLGYGEKVVIWEPGSDRP